ncbi:MAG: four helix bundle protein [Anaerolineales bacterium]
MNEKLPYTNDFKGLLAYQIAIKLAEEIYLQSLSFPREEVYSLTDQIRRSSRSVGANIAEAWGKRLYIKHFISKLTDAIAEVNETEHWIEMAYGCDYLTEAIRDDLIELCVRNKRLVNGMITKANLFCI